MIALDLFAGTGWGVACQWLGIEEYGVEIMPEAVATREANGMTTLYNDVWTGLEGLEVVRTNQGNPRDGYYERSINAPSPTVTGIGGRSWNRVRNSPALLDYSLLIASPPCQTFSMAGGGAGRRALDDVLEAIETRAYLDPAELRAFGEKHDPRTALVLTPLAHVARDTPTFVVFEQVPPVLPVWEACAEHMRRWGYSVWTGNLQAEQYGVPQTRKRAVLIARADGIEAAPPVPTHSRYYSRDAKRLDPGVKPWVSMAEALGWEEQTGIVARKMMGQGMVERYGPRPDRDADDPAFTLRANGGGNASGGFVWAEERPATTVQGDSRIWPPGHKVNAADIARLGEDEARARYGDRAGSKGSARVMRSNYSGGGAPGATAEERGRTMREDDKPSLAMTGKPGHWVRPSFTVTGGGTGSTGGAEPFGSRARSAMPEGASRITVDEAATLQSYPPGFTFCGTKTKQFLQVGNAVPPLLAAAILRGFLP